MKDFLLSVLSWIRRQIWSLIVAYMLGMHNFYFGDNKTADNASATSEIKEVKGDDDGSND